MLKIEITSSDGNKLLIEAPDDCVIGKGAQSEVRLDNWRVSKEHARLFRTPGGVLLEDMGSFGGVMVNGHRIDNQYGPLNAKDVIGIGPFSIQVLEAKSSPVNDRTPLVDRRLNGTDFRNPYAVERRVAARVHADHVQEQGSPEAAGTNKAAGAADTVPAAPRAHPKAPAAFTGSAHDAAKRLQEFEWRKKIHSILLDTMDLRRHDVSKMSDDKLRADTGQLIVQIIQEVDKEIPADIDRNLLRTQVLNEAIGLGPLEELLADDSVSEIMVNRFDEIFVERAGRLMRHPLTFTGDRAVLGVIERIVSPLGRRIDESSPMVDARLKDGSRVNAIIPPLALKGPCLTIRKFSKRKLEAQDLVTFGSISPDMAKFLEVCVVARKNIIVSGGTGSGKTTLLNILSNFIPPTERIITVEDAAELKLHHEHLISLESRPPNIEGKGAILIRDLVKNTLRMRPDRIVVGECRGAEALDMLQAMNTGHEGSLTTLHANTPRDGLARLETMVLMAGMDLPLVAIREQITSAVDIVVQQNRFACGSRLVTSITEITGMESGKIQIQELFRFHNQGYGGDNAKVRGFFTGCDLVPTFYEELRSAGGDLDMAIFKPNGAVEASN